MCVHSSPTGKGLLAGTGMVVPSLTFRLVVSSGHQHKIPEAGTEVYPPIVLEARTAKTSVRQGYVSSENCLSGLQKAAFSRGPHCLSSPCTLIVLDQGPTLVTSFTFNYLSPNRLCRWGVWVGHNSVQSKAFTVFYSSRVDDCFRAQAPFLFGSFIGLGLQCKLLTLALSSEKE